MKKEIFIPLLSEDYFRLDYNWIQPPKPFWLVCYLVYLQNMLTVFPDHSEDEVK